MSQSVAMNCCFSRALKFRNVHSDRLCRSELSEGEGFEDSGFFFCCLFCLVPLCLSVDTNSIYLSSVSTRASIVTFWQEVWVEGREGSAAGAELGSRFLPAGEAQYGGRGTARLNMVKKKHPRTMHMGDGAAQLRRKVHPEVIFILFL